MTRKLAMSIAGMCALSVSFAACGQDDHPVEDGADHTPPTATTTTATTTSTTTSTSTTTGTIPNPMPDPVQPPPEEEVRGCEELDPNTPLDLHLSADDSNSMGSPAQARELLRQGSAPSLVRTYEFLNYYRFGYAAPALGDLAIFPELRAGGDPQDFALQIGVRSHDSVDHRPVTVTFVLDTSGSMSGVGIERERAAVKAIAASLQQGDIVNLVTWNTQNAVVLSGHVVGGPSDAQVLAAADALTTSGGTDLYSGLVLGYQLANDHYGSQRLNRVVLISDGGANVGVTDADLIGVNAEDADDEGIYLLGIGTGPPGNYHDTLMDTVTDAGRGAYVYLDSVDEASAIFVDRYDEVMEVAARGVQIQLIAPWYFQMQLFYGEEYSENPEEVTPQHLAPNDAMVLNQVLRACSSDVVLPTDPITITARWHEPLTYVAREVNVTTTVEAMLAAPAPELTKGRAIVAYAEALKTATQADLQAALAQVEAANPGNTDPDLSEIAELIALHPAF